MNLDEFVNLSKEVTSWIHRETNEITLPSTEKEVFSASILQQSLDIGDAIVILAAKNLIGPIFTLARPHFETYVCGIWLLSYANKNQFENYKKGIYPKFSSMLKTIEDIHETGGAWIKASAVLNKQSFHALTHGGVEHIVRRNFSKGIIEPNYPEDEIRRFLYHSMEIQIGTCAYLFELANNEKKMKGLYELSKHFRLIVTESGVCPSQLTRK